MTSRKSSIVVLWFLLLGSAVACENEKDDINEESEPICNTVYNSFVVAQWNIGHFSGGASPNSTIDGVSYEKKLKAFRSVIDGISANLFSVNEFSEVFGTDSKGTPQKTLDVLFSDYSYRFVGHQTRYSCNALFSMQELNNVTESQYDCNQTAQIIKANHIRATDYYYIESVIKIKGCPVKLVTTHLAFDYGNEVIAKSQILEIIERYKDDSLVILCGDWNIMDVNNFDYFKAAGYQLANHGVYGDYMTFSGGEVLDNIIVKGLNIQNVKMIETSLSDHKPLVVTLTFPD